MLKGTQTRFVGIRDNHNHYCNTSLRLLFSIITDNLLMSKACYIWSVLDLHVGEIHILPVSLFLIIYPHATQKARDVQHITRIHLMQARSTT